MSRRLADWLPPVVREGPGGASDPERLLDALLAAVEEQAALLARDIDQVYDDLFVESCADWAVPYIGSLLGLPTDTTRLEVANTIALRRRKGTPAALEDFAEVVSGWAARVTEGWQVTACAHRLDHPAGPRPAVFDFTDGSKHRAGGPFDRSRRVCSPDRRLSPNGVQLTVWPWTVHTHHDTEVAPTGQPARFALHPLGAECPLFMRPRPLTISRTPGEGRTEDEADAPVRATYRVLEALAAPGDITVGTNWTIAATHPLADADPATNPPLLRLSAIDAVTATRTPIPWSALRFGSLPSGAPAAQPPAADEVVVDINRGAIEVGTDWTGPVRATWHRAVSGELGALPGTGDTDARARVVVTVNPDAVAGPAVVPTIAQAVAAAEALSGGLDPAASRPGVPDVEIRRVDQRPAGRAGRRRPGVRADPPAVAHRGPSTSDTDRRRHHRRRPRRRVRHAGGLPAHRRPRRRSPRQRPRGRQRDDGPCRRLDAHRRPGCLGPRARRRPLPAGPTAGRSRRPLDPPRQLDPRRRRIPTAGLRRCRRPARHGVGGAGGDVPTDGVGARRHLPRPGAGRLDRRHRLRLRRRAAGHADAGRLRALQPSRRQPGGRTPGHPPVHQRAAARLRLDRLRECRVPRPAPRRARRAAHGEQLGRR